MHKVIFSSKTLHKTLTSLLNKLGYGIEIITVIGKEDNMVFDYGTEAINCELKQAFVIQLHRTSIERLIKILALLDDQPVTIGFQNEQSERFGIWIKECIV